MPTTIYYHKGSGVIHSVVNMSRRGGLSNEQREMGLAVRHLTPEEEAGFDGKAETVDSLLYIERPCRFVRPYPLVQPMPARPTAEKTGGGVAILRWIGVGDVLMSLQVAVPSIRAAYPDAHITYWTGRTGARLVGVNRCVDEVREMDWNHGTSPAVSPPPEVAGYDVVINLVNRVDFLPVVTKRNRPDNFLWVANEQLPQGYGKAKKRTEMPSVFFGADSVVWTKRVLEMNRLYSPIVGCQLSSHGKMRYWPVYHWQALARLMPNVTFIWFADQSQFVGIDAPENVLNVSNQLNFDEYLALWSACDATVTPDSGGMHLSGVMNQRCVALAGSTNIKHHISNYTSVKAISGAKLDCMPCVDWQLRSDCRGDVPWCMNGIGPEAVRDAIVQAL